jgi:predicted deacylase
MSWLPSHLGSYPDAPDFERAWDALAARAGARVSIAGTSVEGRPLKRYDFGSESAPAVLLTGLIHAVELIGSLALLDFVKSLVKDRERGAGALLRGARFVVLPIINPDSLAVNSDRLARGKRAYRRGNANGVDLNRNFPRLAPRPPLHPCAGSRFRASPHFIGPCAFSEPESRAVRDVALEIRPTASIGFHSFGNMLLHPWAFTSKANPRAARYARVGAVFRRAQPSTPYALMQARELYATIGDMDDWLDAELGTLAFTVEVSRPGWSNLRPSRLLNPFCWMNPRNVEGTVANLTPGISGLVTEALAA